MCLILKTKGEVKMVGNLKLNLDAITSEDCLDLYEKFSGCVFLNDGESYDC